MTDEIERLKPTYENEKKFQIERIKIQVEKIKICFSPQTFFGYPTITSETTVAEKSGHRNIHFPTCVTGVCDLIR